MVLIPHHYCILEHCNLFSITCCDELLIILLQLQDLGMKVLSYSVDINIQCETLSFEFVQVLEQQSANLSVRNYSTVEIK